MCSDCEGYGLKHGLTRSGEIYLCTIYVYVQIYTYIIGVCRIAAARGAMGLRGC